MVVVGEEEAGCWISRVGAKVRASCISEMAHSYAVGVEECLYDHAVCAQQHATSNRLVTFSYVLVVAVVYSCIISSKSFLSLDSPNRENKDLIRYPLAENTANSACGRFSMPRSTSMDSSRYSGLFVRVKA